MCSCEHAAREVLERAPAAARGEPVRRPGAVLLAVRGSLDGFRDAAVPHDASQEARRCRAASVAGAVRVEETGEEVGEGAEGVQMEMWKRGGPDAADMGSTGSMLEGRFVRRRTKDRAEPSEARGGVVVGTRRLLLLVARGIVVDVGGLALRGVGSRTPTRTTSSSSCDIERSRARGRSRALTGVGDDGRAPPTTGSSPDCISTWVILYSTTDQRI